MRLLPRPPSLLLRRTACTAREKSRPRSARRARVMFWASPPIIFGLKVGMAGKVKFEARIKELVENLPDLAVLVEPLLIVRRVLREQIVILHRRLLAIVRDDDEVCRRLMTVPGVGPVVSLTYR